MRSFLLHSELELWLRDPHNREIWNREHGLERQIPIFESDKTQAQAG